MQVLRSTTLYAANSPLSGARNASAITPANPAQAAANSSSIVSISPAARALAEQGAAAGQAGPAATDDPVENYRLPNWYAGLFGENLQPIDGAAIDREMQSYWGLAEQLSADGQLDQADQARLAALDRPASRAWDAGNEFRAQFRQELDEFQKIFDSAWSGALREQGVNTHQDYVEKVLRAPGDNSALRNSVVEKTLANPRALALIDQLGWKRPALA
ncbi:MAG: hypothetical protein L6Q55_02860 [Azonexus sp.]|nr:hypothetical protein [Azonexus sp.]MCK6411346.1 hypothetical protein [Azonexus sp.]